MITAGGTVLLEARGVHFSFTQPVIRNVSLQLKAGTVTAILGPNGSGKTTVLRLLAGILPSESGVVSYRGEVPLSRMPRREIARHIAMVPQNGRTFYYQTVFQFAMTGRSPHLSLLGFESSLDEEITLEALAMTRMTEFRSKQVAEISGGEKQRLALARALAQQSEILLLDEFTANLDINYQVELLRLIREITRQKGLATLVVSHEINLLANFADTLILLEDGSIFCQGIPSEVATRNNLKALFGVDFSVRLLPEGGCEILPIFHKGS